ncbi:hypothetical protein B0H14DRAFT_3126247 [Mycena olivaceomarginata]|nr:hypothetical protein B0H14DRAFT_3126247 [Mycena olivaceomarginata]
MNSHCGVSYNRSSCHTIFRSRRTVSAVGERIAHSTKFIAILVEKAVEPLAPIRQARFKGGDGMSAAAKKGPRTDETAQSVKRSAPDLHGSSYVRQAVQTMALNAVFAIHLSHFPLITTEYIILHSSQLAKTSHPKSVRHPSKETPNSLTF